MAGQRAAKLVLQLLGLLNLTEVPERSGEVPHGPQDIGAAGGECAAASLQHGRVVVDRFAAMEAALELAEVADRTEKVAVIRRQRSSAEAGDLRMQVQGLAVLAKRVERVGQVGHRPQPDRIVVAASIVERENLALICRRRREILDIPQGKRKLTE